MNDMKKAVLDDNGTFDFCAEVKKNTMRQRENFKASIEISKKLRVIIEKIYNDAGKPSPFKEYYNDNIVIQ